MGWKTAVSALYANRRWAGEFLRPFGLGMEAATTARTGFRTAA